MRRRALLSVSDKRGVVPFARRLHEMGFEIVSTGGTAKTLAGERGPGYPRLGGHGRAGDPGRQGQDAAPQGSTAASSPTSKTPSHVTELVEQDIARIDLVCINLYPFEETVAGGASEAEAVEQIDIGGPAMLRAAAKNFGSVVVVPSPEFYDDVLADLDLGEVSCGDAPPPGPRRVPAYRPLRRGHRRLVRERRSDSRTSSTMRYEKVLPLRYGENPHQEAAYYARVGEAGPARRRTRSCRARTSPSTT